jgi:hypothetical protein
MTTQLRYVDIDALQLTTSQRRAVSDFLETYMRLMLKNADKHHGPEAGIALMVTLADLFCSHVMHANAVGVLRAEHVNACLAAFAKVLPSRLMQ